MTQNKKTGFALISCLLISSLWCLQLQVLYTACILFQKSGKLAWENSQCEILSHSALHYSIKRWEKLPDLPIKNKETFLRQLNKTTKIDLQNIATLYLAKSDTSIYLHCHMITSSAKHSYKALIQQHQNSYNIQKIEKL
ncbi:MAG: hypothetical protein VW378_07620 [bacterium]